MASYGQSVRRGLPRVTGGEPWPSPSEGHPAPATVSEAPPVPEITTVSAVSAVAEPVELAAVVSASDLGGTVEALPSLPPGGRAVRRGLPRVPGGEPWPPAGFAPKEAIEVPRPVEAVEPVAVPVPEEPVPQLAPEAVPQLAPEAKPRRLVPFTNLSWTRAITGATVLLVVAAIVVLAARWLLAQVPLQAFLTDYPGEYHLPAGAPVGIPAWLGWQHFFSVFVMVLIIRSGLQVRTEKRPAVFWSPRRDPQRRISLSAWLHQSLDLLWVTNGVVYVVLLFSTGQWMKIVPTSWAVFPNALSAGLQYLSLDWPTENGWVNYNSLQQLAYFVTVFIAAPLAILTGVRMSAVWPKRAATLSRLYPVEWARAVHFPVMLYFVVFIVVHVTLVLSTGALRNLNHMYAAQGSTDGNAYADNWTGFALFAGSLLVIAGAWVAARPLILVPIARRFGRVSGR